MWKWIPAAYWLPCGLFSFVSKQAFILIPQHGASAHWGNMIFGMGRLNSRRRGFVHDGLGVERKSSQSFGLRPLAQFIFVTRRHYTTQYITSVRYWGRFDTPSCLLRPLEFFALAQTNIESLKAPINRTVAFTGSLWGFHGLGQGLLLAPLSPFVRCLGAVHYRYQGLAAGMHDDLILGTPVVPFWPFYLGVSLLKLNPKP